RIDALTLDAPEKDLRQSGVSRLEPLSDGIVRSVNSDGGIDPHIRKGARLDRESRTRYEDFSAVAIGDEDLVVLVQESRTRHSADDNGISGVGEEVRDVLIAKCHRLLAFRLGLSGDALRPGIPVLGALDALYVSRAVRVRLVLDVYGALRADE